MRPGGRLDRIATLLARAGSLPLTLGDRSRDARDVAGAGRDPTRARAGLAPGAHAAVRRATTQLLPEPYVPIDGPTIEAEDLGAHLPEEYVEGSSAIEQATGEIPDPRTAYVDPIDEATVDRLTQMLVGRFVVRDTALVPVAEPLTPAQPFVLTTSADIAAPAAATDSGIEHLVASDGLPRARARNASWPRSPRSRTKRRRRRAASCSRRRTTGRPTSPPRPCCSGTSRRTRSSSRRRSTRSSPTSPRGRDRRRRARSAQLAPIAPPDLLPLRANEYDAAVRELIAYATMVGAKDPSVDAGRQALLLALSTDNTRSEALAYLHTISTKVDALTNGITTTAKALTLTARRASVPLSFENNSGRAGVKVRVHLDSPKLVFPEGLRLPDRRCRAATTRRNSRSRRARPGRSR